MRNGQLKPGVDWVEIEQRIRDGEGIYVVSKDYDISRQAIDKRAKNKGWVKSQKVVRIARENAKVAKGEKKSATLKIATLPIKRKHVQRFAKDTPETKDAILALIKDGNPKMIACQCAGVSIDSLNRWVEADDDFALMVRQAESEAVAERLSRITNASKRGDWKADTWILERTHKQIFGNDNNRLGAMNLQININRDTSTELVTLGAETVDNTEVSDS